MTSQPLRSRLAIVALLGALLALPMLTTGVQAQAARQLTGPTLAPLSFPADPDGLPAPAKWGKELDPAAGYQPQLACTAKPSRGIVKLRRLALDTYGRGGLSPAYARSCAYGGTSEHKDGRAWDWMLDVGNRADSRAAADFLGWLTGRGPSGAPGEMANRLGVMYVIYNRQIWSSYSPGWRDYTGYDPHTSHIHISLSWNGARAHTSFWTGRVWPSDYGTCQLFEGQPATVPTPQPRIRPCPAPALPPRSSTQPFGWLGSSGEYVATGQRLLGIQQSGSFGRATRTAVLGYQSRHDLPRTGALDKPTWASLMPSTRVLNVPSWTAAQAAQWGCDGAGSPTLHRRDAGRAVYALQVSLELPPAWRNGYFGHGTAAEVTEFKARHGLPDTALVGAEVWAALCQRR